MTLQDANFSLMSYAQPGDIVEIRMGRWRKLRKIESVDSHTQLTYTSLNLKDYVRYYYFGLRRVWNKIIDKAIDLIDGSIGG